MVPSVATVSAASVSGSVTAYTAVSTSPATHCVPPAPLGVPVIVAAETTGARPFTVSVSGDVTTTCALARPDSARPRHAAIIDRRNDVRDLRVRCMEFLRLVGVVARRPRPPGGTPDVGGFRAC